ncbi:Bifunctional inhibitor/plant lipid transfer protein/seed storage helical domain containing protein [Parasponia andersonii]|uniref:Bifunctional inhibitor/plant lipid transfer protein/seed storage helical domain containing protein n=1 Tax=Parasponia andersonii TaxID=3476 RepID=A0A2P5DW85_PARAD|nr:Bifunctional inhibitor/plant lipid transfer protein/seed storage helical domain containing protein [Parasponia andersonii]
MKKNMRDISLRLEATIMLMIVVVVVVVVSIMDKPRVATAVVICSPVEMDPCKEAIAMTASPSSICCQKVREQRPCLCGYLNDPNLRPTINSPNARRVASICGVELFPTCY